MTDNKQLDGQYSEPYIGMPIYLDGDVRKEPETQMPENRMPGNSGSETPDRQPGENTRNCPDNWAVAMAYVPIQQWETPYEAEEAFARGTVFPSLDLPFTGGAGR